VTAPRATLAERLRPRTAGAFARVAPVASSSWFWGGLVGLVAWQTAFGGFAPTTGVDGSWPLGVNLAASAGLDFGTDVAFTYGPLGYLAVPLLVDHELAQLGLLHSLATWIALGVSLVFAARRSFPLPLAVGLALVAAWLADVPLVALALLWCAIAVGEDAPEAARRLLPWIGGAVGAMVLLTKVNEGLLILALCGIAAVGIDRGRRLAHLAALAASFTATFLVLWLITGQGLGDLGEFARTSFEIAAGYSTAQTLEAASEPWRYQLAAAAMFALALGAAYAAGRESGPWRRIALLLLVATAALFAWKTAFVRHELIRSIVVAMVPLTILLAVRWSGRWRSAAAAAFVPVAVVYFPLTGQSVGDVVRPAASVEGVVDIARSVLDPDRLNRDLAASREGLARHYGLDERSLALLRDRDVHVYPYETGLAWTYGLEWDPLPVFQSYVAYTPELDRLNAERLSSPEGPERVLVHSPLLSFGYGAEYFRSLEPSQRGELDRAGDTSVDGRYLVYEQPRTVVALLCHFVPLRTTLAYQVLDRTSDRCGHPRPLRSVAAESGEAVRVPRPPGGDDVVVAGVEGLAPEGAERLGATLYRAPPRRVTFDRERRFRLTPENTASDLLVRAPSAIDFPKPFRLAPNARTVAFSEDSGLLSSPGELLVSFFAMRVEAVHEPAR
jgi:hypothetical protein